MARDKKNSAASDEYQYAGEGMGDESFLEAPQKRTLTLKTIKEKLLERLPKKKKYRVLLFLAIGVYVVYKFLDVGTPPPKTTTPTPAKIVAQPLVKPTNEKAQAVVVEKTLTTPVATNAAKNIELTPNGNSSAVDTPASTSAVTLPNTQVKELQTSLNQINHSVMVLESSLLGLTNSVIRLAEKVKMLETFQKNMAIATIKNPGFLAYHIQSLTAGRAWLESSTGDSVTVKVGDFLPSYGQIQKIDIRTGAIFTSSGRIIHYGPNDH